MTTNVSSSNASPDTESVLKRLCDLRDLLKKDDKDAVTELVRELEKESRPQITMDSLAPYLFLDEVDEPIMTIPEALSLLRLFVACDTKEYLKAASRAVKTAVENLNSATVSVQEIVVTDEVLSTLVAQLSGDDVEVATNASATITICCRRLGPPLSDQAIRAIFDSWIHSHSNMDDNRSKHSTVCVRCASTVVDIATIGDANMESAITCGATNILLTMVTDETDPLLQISSLDLIERLSNTLPMHGKRARWLFSHNVLHPLLVMAGGSSENDSPDPILGGTALRLISSLCRLAQSDSTLFGLGGSELLRGFHHALRNFDGSGELQKLAFIDAVSSFASASPEALEIVLEDSVLVSGWLSLNLAQPKLKSVVLTSVAMVLSPPAQLDSNGDSLIAVPSNVLSMRLYSSLGQVNDRESTELIMSLTKSSLVTSRLGAYALLEAVAKRGTGAQVLLSHGGFYEFLISREGETTKEGKEAKYAIVQAVMQSDARGLLSENIVNSLEKILSQGPHYVQTQNWDVVTE